MPGMSHYQRQFVKVMKAVGKYDNGQSFSTLQASEASGVPFGRTGEILDDLASQKVIGRGPDPDLWFSKGFVYSGASRERWQP
jgi:hypothetical protein